MQLHGNALARRLFNATGWQIKFTGLPSRLIYGPRAERLRQYREGAFFYLTNYEQVVVDGVFDLKNVLLKEHIGSGDGG